MLTTVDQLMSSFEQIEQRLGYTFHDRELLLIAFTHRSFANEHQKTHLEHNERLEFFGDSVLNLIVSEYLFLRCPDLPEGDLTSLRASLVDATACADYINHLDVMSYLLMGKGERYQSFRSKSSVGADLFEAIIGAIYLDSNLQKARNFFLGHFSREIVNVIKSPPRNWKIELQEFVQKKMQLPPTYKTEQTEGPEHNKRFVVSVWAGDEKLAEGRGKNKKEAQQDAAENGMKIISQTEK